MPKGFPTIQNSDESEDIVADIRGVLESTHLVWSNPSERRRMRYFGFRPAVEPGVLKREWHEVAVRVSQHAIIAAWAGVGEVVYRAEDRQLLFDGAPFTATQESMDVITQLLDLIGSYERWVEAREGKQERISRGQVDGRTVNPLADTRRFHRTMQVRRRRTP